MIGYGEFMALSQSPDSEERGMAAHLAALAYLNHKGPADEQAALYAALFGFLEDRSVKVRAALAYGLLHSAQAPRPLMLALLQDAAVIGRAVMQHSPALVDADLLPLARSAPVDDLVCLAQREKLSPRLADALLARGIGAVDLVVLRRGELALSAERLRDKAVVSGEIPAIRGALLARTELPADVRLALVQAAGRAIAGLRIVKGAIAPERLARLLRNAEDAALATIGEGASQGEETGGFARHVIATGRLNTRILMHAMVHGQAMFFAACCATLSQLPQRKVFAVLGSGSRTALNALFVRCGLEPGVRNLFARLIEYARSVNLADDLAARHYVVNALTEDLLAEHDGAVPDELAEAFAYLGEQNVVLARKAAKGVLASFAGEQPEAALALPQAERMALPAA
jgi:uncharacterized protein (DUF2336 family)